MSNTVRPSTKMLPMDDIATVLKIEHGFSSKDDVALDTQKVSGTNAGLIAVAATDETGNLIEDRETVKNALQLGGVEADGYMTRADGTRIEAFGDTISTIYANEIALLRDELYQMRGELTRQGLLNEYGIYSGYQDFFRSGDKKYQFETLGGLAQNSTSTINVNTIYPEYADTFKAGDWFIIHKVAQNASFLVHAIQVGNGEVRFERQGNAAGIPSTGLEVGNVELYKVLGEYNRGSFSFSQVVENAITNKEKYTMFNDDSNPKMEPIEATEAGFAAAFNVPGAVAGALKRFSVMARSSGSPGALTCYVMEDTSANLLSLQDLGNEIVGPNNMIKAKSSSVSANKAATPSPTEITFEFQNPVDGSYPILQGSKRYVFIVVAAQANLGGDKWEIQFSRNIYDSARTDVQTNNKAYTYKAGTGLTEITSIGDLVFILATIEVRSNDENPFQEGLYTSQTIALPHAVEASRARLVIRVNREGNFVTEEAGVCGDGGTFSVIHDPLAQNGNLPNDLGLRGGDKIAIGTEIRTLTTDCSSMQLTIDKGVYLDSLVPVHRIGYTAYIRAHKRVWDAATNTFVESNHQLLPLELTAIIPDRIRVAPNQSNRLVFECEFRDQDTHLPLDVNTLELQVIWTSSVSRDYMIANGGLIGRIYDLTLSFDRTL